jgi:hypothetical protein
VTALSRRYGEFCLIRTIDNALLGRTDSSASWGIEHEKLEKEKGMFDVAISLEVAEHLPGGFADRFIDLLTGLSKTVVFTAATPGQGGVGHLNELPHAYWIDKFKIRDYHFDEGLSQEWRQQWAKESVAYFYQKTS